MESQDKKLQEYLTEFSSFKVKMKNLLEMRRNLLDLLQREIDNEKKILLQYTDWINSEVSKGTRFDPDTLDQIRQHLSEIMSQFEALSETENEEEEGA
jgi:hypothetical protein